MSTPESDQARQRDASDGGLAGIEHVLAVLSAMGPGGAVVAHLIQQMPSVQRHNAVTMVDQLLGLVERDPEWLLERLASHVGVRRLVWDACRAATETDEAAKIRALARAAVPGVVDDARVDESRLMVAALAGLEPIHVLALVALETCPLDQGQNHTAGNLVELLGVSMPVAQAIVATLYRLALVYMPAMSFRGLPHSARIAPLGLEVLALLRGGEG